MPSIRPAAVAGLFYPDNPAELSELIAAYLARAGNASPDDAPAATRPPKMLVVPHAGYVYSGEVAACAYARLAPCRGRIRRVVLLGPAHRVPVRGLAAPTVTAFETPLGRVTIDRAAIADLRPLPQLVVDDRPHALEHSLEVQLPFLQTLLGDFALVPLAVGDAAPEEVADVLDALWGGGETLVVVSTDLSHYLPYAQARVRDRATIARVLALEDGIDLHEACGAMPLNGALRLARQRGLEPHLVDLRNSGDTAGDKRRVVGYGAIVFEPAPEPPALADDPALGRALIAAARNAIARRLGLPAEPEPAHPALVEPGATFVSLFAAGALRGCKGHIEAQRPLLAEVRANAEAAAFDDCRFAPVASAEWPGLRVGVSLLGPLSTLHFRTEPQALAALRPHEDGVVLRWRSHGATLLPSVWQQVPAARDFLAALKRKAGLRADFWAPDLRLMRFAARRYQEERA